VVQMVEHSLGKFKALSSNPNSNERSKKQTEGQDSVKMDEWRPQCHGWSEHVLQEGVYFFFFCKKVSTFAWKVCKPDILCCSGKMNECMML
jgi:hypothetical protein